MGLLKVMIKKVTEGTYFGVKVQYCFWTLGVGVQIREEKKKVH